MIENISSLLETPGTVVKLESENLPCLPFMRRVERLRPDPDAQAHPDDSAARRQRTL